MTRTELNNLKAAHEYIVKWGKPFAAAATLTRMIGAAEAEHAAEDRHHDATEADTYPMNIAAE